MQKADISQCGNIKKSLSILPKLNQHNKSLHKAPIIINMGHSRSHLQSYTICDELHVKKKKLVHFET